MPETGGDWSKFVEAQDRLYAVLESTLGKHDSLRHGRRLAVDINTVTVFASHVDSPPPGSEGVYLGFEEVANWVADLPEIEPEIEHSLQAALQRVTTIKPTKKRASVQRETSRGAVLKEIERGIANLDRWQKTAAIETPTGPQRIRGLAGSGKTVVLALKAAYLHAQHPDWRIVVTFHTRALYQQINDLITRFTFEYSNDRPDEQHLQIMHSWGSSARAGVYSEMAMALGETPRDYNYARSTYGQGNEFQGICKELLSVAKQQNPEPVFDVVLIDEAQDLPPEFFQLVYLLTKDPKRIVWGFDELQKLSEAAMPGTDDLFGTGPSGESLISLESGENEPRRDIVLDMCYRNTPWALATAHALGIGVYRTGGLLQHFDEPKLWKEIGYNVVHGDLRLGAHVTLERSQDSYPAYFPELINEDDAVVLQKFEDQIGQDAWVAMQIKKNLTEDELEADDILIVLPDVRRAKSRAPRLQQALKAQGIDSHLVGVNTGVDEVFVPNSVALAHIYRAKGNEAPMVYVVDSQMAASSYNAVTQRNTLFTAITRSRAWVRITGWGPSMDLIAREVETVKQKNFRLDFPIPSAIELKTLRHIYRDRSGAAQESAQRATEQLQAILEAVDRGEIDLHDVPPGLRTRLVAKMREETPGDDY
ncbi:DEAD/DEAH box helicase [Streptomyces sp. MBT53]|uniref:DEAD/DEAH box helicase n=1 Tax=Streptomyces sp. MBT53 TaxID=1488384 RepID=UPI001912652D|nr:ATP-binding domain-containing protein [Streptomyces sp. MBT53]MBK6013778.1 DEAD/DEAH box helicase [Streptomyces sp. MBT53]